MNVPKIVVVVVAAGKGERFGGAVPKQYISLGAEVVLARTVAAFVRHPAIAHIQVVINPEHQALYDVAIAHISSPALLPPVVGGATRQASVVAGLQALIPFMPDIVLVHDAARPFVSAELISRVIEATQRFGAVVPALPVTDTIKRVVGEVVTDTVDRSQLRAVQTPQGFSFETLLRCHQTCTSTQVTDDASVVEQMGLPVMWVEGEATNRKITTQEDVVKIMETRVGTGFDVHAFEDGDAVILCGVKIPHTHKLKGHSDADVGLHALVDALLGAVAEGDIGQHFPPSDAQWKNADSGMFVEHVRNIIARKGGRITHVDITLICERPKIGGYRDVMRQKVADLLQLPLHRVSVKATTTEKLGFTGREEGIAAQAVASVVLPSVAE
jgi:2-C-methyl-D-erythritol 4-phosphate cytidylyltransferase / 2-C-methyl-D-erythritol 2,4-cyclodiphosphate synthase